MNVILDEVAEQLRKRGVHLHINKYLDPHHNSISIITNYLIIDIIYNFYTGHIQIHDNDKTFYYNICEEDAIDKCVEKTYRFYRSALWQCRKDVVRRFFSIFLCVLFVIGIFGWYFVYKLLES